MMPRFFRRASRSAPASRPRYRPSLDLLEGRALLSGAGATIPLAPPPLGMPLSPPEATNLAPPQAVTTAPNVPVSAAANSPPMTVDVMRPITQSGAVNAAIRPGLIVNIVGNTNPDLAEPHLSDGNLVLTFAPGQVGTANVTVCATDAAGASVQVTFVITVGANTPR
jgi:hypothetical protein